MKLLKFMQKVPTTQTNLCIEYIADGLKEIQKHTNENLTSSYISLVADQSEYDFPDNFVAMRHILINTSKVSDYGDYVCQIKGRDIVIKKWNFEDNTLDAPDESIADAIELWYTKADTGFTDSTITEDSDFNITDDVIDALLYYVRAQLTPMENIQMKAIFERRFFSKVGDLDYNRSGRFSVVSKPYLRSLRVLTSDEDI